MSGSTQQYKNLVVKTPAIGSEVTLKKEIGNGSFSSVYLTSNKNYVAKVLNMNFEPSAISFHKEKRMYELVGPHPHIVRFYGTHSIAARNLGTIILECCPKGSLVDVMTLSPEQKLSVAQILRVIFEVADALSHLHSKRITHRDIKIENILVGEDLAYKICDFGSASEKYTARIGDHLNNKAAIADLIAEITRNTTPMYRAPEQLDPQLFPDAAIAEKVDIFALGVVAYILCFKKPPFESAHGAIQGCCYWPEFSTISDDLQLLIQRMLAVNPDERPSANELIEIIQTSFKFEYPKDGQIDASIFSQACQKTVKPTIFQILQTKITGVFYDTEGWVKGALQYDENGPKQKYIRKLLVKAWRKPQAKVDKFYEKLNSHWNDHRNNSIINLKLLIMFHNYLKKGPSRALTSPNAVGSGSGNSSNPARLLASIEKHWLGIEKQGNVVFAPDPKRTMFSTKLIIEFARLLQEKLRIGVQYSTFFEGNFSLNPFLQSIKKNFKPLEPSLLFDLFAYLERLLTFAQAHLLQVGTLWKIQTSLALSILDEIYCLICVTLHLYKTFKLSTNYQSSKFSTALITAFIAEQDLQLETMYLQSSKFFQTCSTIVQTHNPAVSLIPKLPLEAITYIKNIETLSDTCKEFNVFTHLNYSQSIEGLKLPLSFGPGIVDAFESNHSAAASFASQSASAHLSQSQDYRSSKLLDSTQLQLKIQQQQQQQMQQQQQNHLKPQKNNLQKPAEKPTTSQKQKSETNITQRNNDNSQIHSAGTIKQNNNVNQQNSFQQQNNPFTMFNDTSNQKNQNMNNQDSIFDDFYRDINNSNGNGNTMQYQQQQQQKQNYPEAPQLFHHEVNLMDFESLQVNNNNNNNANNLSMLPDKFNEQYLQQLEAKEDNFFFHPSHPILIQPENGNNPAAYSYDTPNGNSGASKNAFDTDQWNASIQKMVELNQLHAAAAMNKAQMNQQYTQYSQQQQNNNVQFDFFSNYNPELQQPQQQQQQFDQNRNGNAYSQQQQQQKPFDLFDSVIDQQQQYQPQQYVNNNNNNNNYLYQPQQQQQSQEVDLLSLYDKLSQNNPNANGNISPAHQPGLNIVNQNQGLASSRIFANNPFYNPGMLNNSTHINNNNSSINELSNSKVQKPKKQMIGTSDNSDNENEEDNYAGNSNNYAVQQQQVHMQTGENENVPDDDVEDRLPKSFVSHRSIRGQQPVGFAGQQQLTPAQFVEMQLQEQQVKKLKSITNNSHIQADEIFNGKQNQNNNNFNNISNQNVNPNHSQLAQGAFSHSPRKSSPEKQYSARQHNNNNNNLNTINNQNEGSASSALNGNQVSSSQILYKKHEKLINYIRNEVSSEFYSFIIDYGEFEMGPKVGSGNSCDVYRGTCRNQDVAIKEIKMGHSNEEHLKEFQREIAALIKLKNHENLLQLVAISSSDNKFYIITEFCEGSTLFEILHNKKKEIKFIPWNHRLNWLIHIAQGMSYLHANGLIHRDLKSLNLLLNSVYSVSNPDDIPIMKIADFGLTKVGNSLLNPHQSGVLGTFHWMAPETMRGFPSTPKSDVYSFAIVMWELCARQTPYKGLAVPEIVKFVTDGLGRPDRTQLPFDIPNGVKALMEQCWSENPQQRPDFNQIITSLHQISSTVNNPFIQP